ncbi:MAG: alanyl-tRNA editing protein [Paracoccaceae bacterium]
MTEKTFHQNAYLTQAKAVVIRHSPEGGVILDQSIFYPTGGGQPGDGGKLEWLGNTLPVATTMKGDDQEIILLPGAPEILPPVGTEVTQVLDWDRRFSHMQVHTALHLLSVAVAMPVSGGSISTGKGRLDFSMPEAVVDKKALEAALNDMVVRDLSVHESWISDAQLRADPGLVKTMSVAPPMGQGRIRLIAIGKDEQRIDFQPCGGTHVARTGEIGRLRVGKIQNKGRQNRRIYLHIDKKEAA